MLGIRSYLYVRTDAGVHAVRNAFIVHVPIEIADEGRRKLLNDWNEKVDGCAAGSLRILDFHPVSKGFCSRRNVSYRYNSARLVS